jgi:hypothetical protein
MISRKYQQGEGFAQFVHSSAARAVVEMLPVFQHNPYRPRM